jgi:hypothetical protein
MKNLFLKNSKGYAILFTVVIIGIISMIALGLVNSAYKQLILSSVAKDSQIAFYQSDSATECALYADNQTTIPTDPAITTWTCGKDSAGNNLTFNITTPTGNRADGYNLVGTFASPSLPCFNITTTKTTTIPVITTVNAKGYNICNLSSPRTVERAIKLTY